jgi:hypothetical protein
LAESKGPIFISHSTADHEDVINLGHALRAALKSQVRIFNTSDFAITPGTRWRDRIITAIRDSSVVVLWATPNALESKEVAFEIGAAFAFDKAIIPCCVHVPPSSLPWSLSEIQAHTVLDKEDGWDQLATVVANQLNLPIAIDKAPLLEFATRFRATSQAVEFEAIGLTIEIRNTSTSAVTGLGLEASDQGETLPAWASAFQDIDLAAGESKLLIRGVDTPDRHFRLTWTDAVGIPHTRDVSVPGTVDMT